MADPEASGTQTGNTDAEFERRRGNSAFGQAERYRQLYLLEVARADRERDAREKQRLSMQAKIDDWVKAAATASHYKDETLFRAEAAEATAERLASVIAPLLKMRAVDLADIEEARAALEAYEGEQER